jgi:hypothetical protein
MKVEVDQSGKIGDTKIPTVLAFSNGEQYTILISAKVKRFCIRYLRTRGYSGPSFYLRLFTIGLFFLLKSQISKLSQVVIDVEYFGKDQLIKEQLINLLNRHNREEKVNPDAIQFGYIGKKSQAHLIALQTFRRQLKLSRTLSERELIGAFGR